MRIDIWFVGVGDIGVVRGQLPLDHLAELEADTKKPLSSISKWNMASMLHAEFSFSREPEVDILAAARQDRPPSDLFYSEENDLTTGNASQKRSMK
jgi:hypothetical protein